MKKKHKSVQKRLVLIFINKNAKICRKNVAYFNFSEKNAEICRKRCLFSCLLTKSINLQKKYLFISIKKMHKCTEKETYFNIYIENSINEHIK